MVTLKKIRFSLFKKPTFKLVMGCNNGNIMIRFFLCILFLGI
jgi:hypothetical protein